MKVNIFILIIVFNLQVVMKMETLSRDSLYLKQRLNLNIDVEFVRQGGKEGHTTADRWKVDSGKSTYNSTMLPRHNNSMHRSCTLPLLFM